MIIISIAGILGADTTAFSALIVGAGVAIGSALNGTLGNFAGGVMLLVFKPFKVGDMIEAQGITGVVTEQGVFNTTVLTAENKTVYLPNGALSTNTIANYTTHGSLRVDITMAIAPDMDIEKAKKSPFKRF
ncbi:MAG: mechanosensitive ion channel [Bacteroidetes bacterium]|nr:mechanosensitive ion channel [Bacteroidota bacterium]